MGKAVVIGGGTGNSAWGNKFDNTDDLLFSDIINYTTVTAVEDVYTFDLESKPIKNFRITTADATAKTVALANVPDGDCEIFIELTYTNAAAITWFEGITWLIGFAPTFTEGKVYRIALFKYGTGWHGNCVWGVVM